MYSVCPRVPVVAQWRASVGRSAASTAPQSMTEVVLDAGPTPDLYMFRLAEDPSLLVIDAHLRAALHAHAPEGGWGIMLEALDER